MKDLFRIIRIAGKWSKASETATPEEDLVDLIEEEQLHLPEGLPFESKELSNLLQRFDGTLFDVVGFDIHPNHTVSLHVRNRKGRVFQDDFVWDGKQWKHFLMASSVETFIRTSTLAESRTASYFEVRKFFPSVTNPLFHGTWGESVPHIVREGFRDDTGLSNFGGESGDGISFTRNLDFLLRSTTYGQYIFVVDRNDLSRKFKIDPFFWGMLDGRGQGNTEYEERVMSGRIPPNYIRGLILDIPIENVQDLSWFEKLPFPVIYQDDGWKQLNTKLSKKARIPTPPRDLRLFIQNRVKEEQAYIDSVLNALNFIVEWFNRAFDEDGPDVMDYTTNSTLDSYFIQSIQRILEEYRTPHWSYPSTEEKITWESLQYLPDTVKRTIDYFDGNFREHLKLFWEYLDWDRFVSRLDNYGISSVPQPLSKAFENLSLDNLDRFIQTRRYFLEKLQDQFYYRWKTDTEAPETDDVEVLYHASVFARQLYEDGFKHDFESNIGLGGGGIGEGGVKLTSFTSDLFIAKEIARSLKELAMLMQGVYPLHKFVRDMQADGIYEKVMESYRGLKGHTKIETKEDLFEVYRRYLTFNGKRYDPYFGFNSDKMFEVFSTVNISDIGVVSAEVDMRYPGIEYRRGEYEFRVPPQAIVTIRGLIQ